jgi:hypothetical protein
MMVVDTMPTSPVCATLAQMPLHVTLAPLELTKVDDWRFLRRNAQPCLGSTPPEIGVASASAGGPF